MARYDGMEELLERVSKTMTARTGAEASPAVSVAEAGPEYPELLEQVLLAVRETTVLTDMLPEYAATLTDGQREDVAALLGKLRHQVQRCQETIAP